MYEYNSFEEILDNIKNGNLKEEFESLEPRARDVFRLAFGLIDGRRRPFQEISELFGIEKNQVEYYVGKVFRSIRSIRLKQNKKEV